MADWQKIETAPQDGTWILACWCQHNAMGVVRFAGGDWLENDAYVSDPTHWQPLPEPPK